jgi:hypothetical protein
MAAVALSFAFEGKLADVQWHYEALRQQQQTDRDAFGAAASARAIGGSIRLAATSPSSRPSYNVGTSWPRTTIE